MLEILLCRLYRGDQCRVTPPIDDPLIVSVEHTKSQLWLFRQTFLCQFNLLNYNCDPFGQPYVLIVSFVSTENHHIGWRQTHEYWWDETFCQFPWRIGRANFITSKSIHITIITMDLFVVYSWYRALVSNDHCIN